ncbi:MAG: glycosyltransferase family 39 protein [Candidatus Eisenbacteria bacterium]|uniref:Glycosyltransferase family 39 protein n=1 Tax=Eiseniibacteriota bacterium TaxID=2212470 RepID=A0A933SC68_UNCEI|nr:glycosyltransferase family 39 protein [Candidatus Eisenbacteria bacterium]
MPNRRATLLKPADVLAPGALVREQVALMVVVAVTLFVRIAFISTLRNEYYFADTVEYRANALEMLAGRVLDPSTPRAPVFPAFLAIGYALFGLDNFLALRLMQLVLSVALVLAGVSLGRRVGGPAIGILTGLGIALSPTLVFSNGLLYPTTLYTLLLLCVTLGAWSLAEKPSLLKGLGLGVALALGILTDQVMAAPGAAVFGWLAWQARRGGRAVLFATLLAVATTGVITELYVRSQSSPETGEAPFVGKAQWTLWYARTDVTMRDDRRIQFPLGTEFHPLPAKQFLAREWNYVKTRPLDYAHDFAFEFLHFYWPEVDRLQTTNRFTTRNVRLVGAVHFWPVLVFAMVGLAAGLAKRRDRALLILVSAATAAFYSLFFTQTRYRIPIEPQMTLLAALGFERLWPGLSRWIASGSSGASGASLPHRD